MKLNNAITPIISVVLPVYNGEIYLREAIESILRQTYEDFEFIIIDDGSTDNSLKIIQEYLARDARIVLISRANKGLVATLNEGISLAKGVYIARMDADDISSANRFECQLMQMKADSADICGCHYMQINEFGKFTNLVLAPLDNDSLLLYLTLAVPFAHGSVLFRKDFLIQNKLKYGIAQIYAEDKYLWSSMYKLGAVFTNVNAILFFYRELDTSLSKSKFIENRRDESIIRKSFISENIIAIEDAVTRLAGAFRTLTFREKEHLLDVCLILFVKKWRWCYLTAFKKANPKMILVAVVKLLAKVV